MISRRKASLFFSSGTGQAGGLLTMSPSSLPLRAVHVNLEEQFIKLLTFGVSLTSLYLQKDWQNVEDKEGDLGNKSFKNSDDF